MKERFQKFEGLNLLKPMLSGQSPAIRFIVIAVALTLLQHGALEYVVNLVTGRGVDVKTKVAGKPLSHWLGKTAKDVLKEAGEDGLQEVRQAFADRGIPFEDDTQPKEAAEMKLETGGSAPENGTQLGTAGNPGTPPVQRIEASNSAVSTGSASKEPELKIGDYLISDLVGKSDDELRKLKGIGSAAIKKLREYEEKLEGQKEAAAAAQSK